MQKETGKLIVISCCKWWVEVNDFKNGRNELKTKKFFPSILDFKNYAENAISMKHNMKEMREIPKMNSKQNKVDQTRFQMNCLTTAKLNG